MAKLALNSALKDIRGMIDGWIYKRFGDRLILARRGVNENPPTAGQLVQREQFRLASDYAQLALADPALRAFYQQAARDSGGTLRSTAIGDYFNAPVITKIDVSGYHGMIGGTIGISPAPSADVTGVTVTLRDATNATRFETGAAMLVSGKWTYTATVAAPSGHAVTIEVKATDRAGKERSLTAQWSG